MQSWTSEEKTPAKHKKNTSVKQMCSERGRGLEGDDPLWWPLRKEEELKKEDDTAFMMYIKNHTVITGVFKHFFKKLVFKNV